MSARRGDPAGFLMGECLAVLALVAILLAASLADWQPLRWSLQAGQWGQQMQISLAQLRRQAMRDGRDLSLCASADGQRCQPVWTAAWMVFADDNGDGLRQPEERGMVMSPAIPNAWRVYWRGFRSQSLMLWLANGDAATSNGSLTLCPPGRHDAALRQLVISKSGRVRVVRPARSGAAALAAARAVCGWS